MVEQKAEFVMKKAIEMIKEEFPPLIYAVNLLTLKNVDKEMNISTDKEFLLYHPATVLFDLNTRGLRGIQYEILHVLMHALLGHWEMDGLYTDKQLLWVSMDREVGHLLEVLGYKCQMVEEANEEVDEFVGEIYDMGVYYMAKSNKRLRRQLVSLEIVGGLVSDDHKLWQRTNKPRQNQGAEKELSVKQDEKKKIQSGEKKDGGQGGMEDAERAEKWAIAREMLTEAGANVDAQTLAASLMAKQVSRSWGSGAGEYGAAIVAAEENQNSYYSILRQFLINQSEQKAPPEAIDFMLYQYGLELYGDVPLLEPPDSEEQLKLNTICIAIDTSGSCSGRTARLFLRETSNLFRDMNCISNGGELYVFQCDEQIQKVDYYDHLEELSEEDFGARTLYGWGGTSFCPVFDSVNKLVEEGKKIDCLIYLSDAEGDFPKERPEYPVFFVLPDTEEEIEQNKWLKQYVPGWVQLISIGKED